MSKEEIDKDLIPAIKWAAAEYNYLKELKEELAEIEKEEDVKKEVKEISKAIRILRYVGKAERRTNSFGVKTEEDLKRINKELSTYLNFDFLFNQELVELTRNIHIESESLELYTSRYEGLLRKKLTQAKVEAQLLVGINHYGSAEKIHTSFLDLIRKTQEQVKNAESWVAALEASLKKAQELLEKLPKDKYTVLERYFDGRKLAGEELEEVYKHRTECINQVIHYQGTRQWTSFNVEGTDVLKILLKDYFSFGDSANKKIKEFFKGKAVIDLGSGSSMNRMIINAALSDWGAEEYIGVDYNFPPSTGNSQIRGVKEDALSYLIKVNDGSAFVISFGFLIFDEILPPGPMGRDYLHFLTHEIARITPKNGFTFHFYCEGIIGEFLIEEGFKVDKQLTFGGYDIFGIKR